MAIRSEHLVVSLISHQGHYTFLYRYAKHKLEGGGKEPMNKHGLGSAPSTRRGKTMWHFCAALRVFTGYHRRIFARKFHKATRNADPSLDCLLCPASIFSLPLSADGVLLWTAISSWLFSSALLCQLTPSVLSGTVLPSSTSGLALKPFVFVLRQNRQRDSPTDTHTNRNERHPSCYIVNDTEVYGKGPC